MPSRQIRISVQSRKPGSILFGDKILSGFVPLIHQRTANDLLYFSIMNVDTWSESHTSS